MASSMDADDGPSGATAEEDVSAEAASEEAISLSSVNSKPGLLLSADGEDLYLGGAGNMDGAYDDDDEETVVGMGVGGHLEDLVTRVCGGFGRWQWQLLGWAFLASFFGGYHNTGHYVLHSANTPHFHCNVPHLEGKVDWTIEQIKTVTQPDMDDPCFIYDRNYSSLSSMSYEQAMLHLSNQRRDDQVRPAGSIPCTQWVYDTTDFASTTVTDWNLVCSRSALRPTIQSVHMCGVLLGSLLFGIVSDRYGRRWAAIPGAAVVLVASVASAVVPYYPLFLAMRFLAGAGMVGLYASSYVVMLEWMGVERRALSTMLYEMGPPAGVLCSIGLSYLLTNWRHLHLAMGIATSVFILYYWILPESPRWLLVRGRLQQLERMLRKAAASNRKELPTDTTLQLLLQRARVELCVQQQLSADAETKESGGTRAPRKGGGVMSLVRTPQMRSRSLKLGLLWLTIGTVSYGTTFLLARLALSTRVLLGLHEGVTLLTRSVAFKPIDHWGRKRVHAAAFFGIALFSMLACLPFDYPVLIGTFLLLSRVCTATNFTLIYLYTAELMPTQMRNLSINCGSVCARIGAILAPFLVDLLGWYHVSIPTAIFGCLSLAAGMTCLYLPETMGRPLPDTIQDVEDSMRSTREGQRLHSFKREMGRDGEQRKMEDCA